MQGYNTEDEKRFYNNIGISEQTILHVSALFRNRHAGIILAHIYWLRRPNTTQTDNGR